MSRYTTQLRWIVENLSSGLEPPEGQEYPSSVYSYIGLSSYPIFDESYRVHLNDKIIDHFYFQEIGFETPAMFARMMKRTMNEVMPKYNALYEAQQDLDAHPLADYWRHIDETVSDTGDIVRAYDVTDTETRNFTDQETKNLTDTETRNMTDRRVLDKTDERTYNVTDTETPNLTKTDSYTNYHETDTDTREIGTVYGKTRGTTDSSSTSGTTSDRNVFEDTPMSLLSNSGSPSVSGLDYATNVTYDDGTSSTTVTSTGSVTDGGRDTEIHSGTVDKAITGSKQQAQTGTDTKRKTGTDTLDTDATDTTTKTGTDTTTRTGTDTKASSGSGTKAKDGTVTDTTDTVKEREFTEYGRNHNQAWLLKEFEKNYVNIDMMIIDELETLFMGVW